MTPGTIVQIEPSKEIVYAIVVRSEGVKLHLVTERGKRLSCPESKVCLATTQTFDATGTDQILAARVRAFREEVEATASAISIEELWEFLQAEGEALPLHEIVELYFGEVSDLHRFAMRQLLAVGWTYFERKKDLYHPRKKEIVEQIEAREAAKERREQRLEEASTWLRKALREGANLDEEHGQGAIELLRGIALFGEEFPRYREGMRLLEAVGHATKHPQPIATELLIELGFWAEDENELLLRHQISREPPAEVLHELDEICRNAARSAPDPTGRTDLTDLFTVTIDDEETLDIDDALSLEPHGSGWRLYIHITDVAATIPQGSALDAFAAQRGTTIYLPEERIPLFPPQLSEDLLSLKAKEIRPAITFFADFDANLDLTDQGIFRSLIRVDERWDYVGVNEALARPGEHRWLETLLGIADRLRQARRERGAIMIHRPEVKVRVCDGEISIKSFDTGSPSYRLVAETMILANTIAAQFCIDNDLPAVYRIQPPPEDDIPLDELDLSDPYGRYHLYCRMRKSTNAPLPDRHSGLGVPAYTQASSPIRRYHDLVMQRQIGTFLDEGRPRYSREEVLEAIATAEEGIAAAATIESARKRYWFLRYLGQHLDEVYEGVILRQFYGQRYLVQLSPYEFNVACVLDYALKPGDRVRLIFAEVNPRRNQVVVREVLRGEEGVETTTSSANE